jgi:hypothetical protein
MVISNLNTARILELLRFIETCVQEMTPFSRMTKEEFLSDRKNPPLQSYDSTGTILSFFVNIPRDNISQAHSSPTNISSRYHERSGNLQENYIKAEIIIGTSCVLCT